MMKLSNAYRSKTGKRAPGKRRLLRNNHLPRKPQFQRTRSTARFVEMNLRMEKRVTALDAMSVGGGYTTTAQGLSQFLKVKHHGPVINVRQMLELL